MFLCAKAMSRRCQESLRVLGASYQVHVTYWWVENEAYWIWLWRHQRKHSRAWADNVPTRCGSMDWSLLVSCLQAGTRTERCTEEHAIQISRQDVASSLLPLWKITKMCRELETVVVELELCIAPGEFPQHGGNKPLRKLNHRTPLRACGTWFVAH